MSAAPKRGACSACGARVTWALFPDRVVRPIEACADGDGTIALQPPLPGVGALGRIEARIVSGVRSAYRLHVQSCPRAALFRNRWCAELRCSACGAELVAPENGRSICSPCQLAERAALAHLADRMVEQLGQAGAQLFASQLQDIAAARAVEGKR
jgi:hypothetical protein